MTTTQQVYRAYKTEIAPTEEQLLLLLKGAGVARFAWNWALKEETEYYDKNGKFIPEPQLRKALNRIKAEQFPWMLEVSKCSPQESIRDLGKALKNFFQMRKRPGWRSRAARMKPRKDGRPHGFPRFKSRKDGVGSFRLTGSIIVTRDTIQLPKIGVVRLKEHGYLPTKSRILASTVSERAGRWFASVQVVEKVPTPEPIRGPKVGVDMACGRDIAVLSDGTHLPNPRGLERARKELRRLQRSLDRKRSGSRNQTKKEKMIVKLHLRITNIRKDATHKATTMLAKTKSAIGVESLSVQAMMQKADRSLAMKMTDSSMSERLRQLEYKTRWYGSQLVKAGPFYPSTLRCSVCGYVKPSGSMPPSVLMYECESCGQVMARNLNSARNLEPDTIAAVSCTVTLEGPNTERSVSADDACQSPEVSGPEGPVLVNEAGTTSLRGGP